MPISSQYSSTTIPPWMEALARSIGEQSQKIASEQYHPYKSPRIAPFSKEQMEAQRLGRLFGSYEPYLKSSQELTQRAGETFPGVINRYMNPYQEAVVNRIGQLGARQFRENILPALESSFVGMGQHGSLQHRQLAERAARDLQESILARQQAALHQGYGEAAKIHEADRLRALQAAEGMREIGKFGQAGRLTDITSLEHIGEQQRALQQANLDTAYQDFLRQKAFPRQQLAEHAATFQGLPYSQHTYGQQAYPNVLHYPQSSASTGGRPNTLSQIGSLAGQLFGLRQMMRKEGGSIKTKASPTKKISKNTLNSSSFVRHPKVGGKHSLLKEIL